MNRIISPLRVSIFLAVTLFILNGCAVTPSRQFRKQVGESIAFEELVKNAGAHQGRKVILGGRILETENKPQTTLITLLQAPLDSQNKPRSRDLSEGRFMARVQGFLDPEIYSKGRELTVAGTVLETLEQPLGNRVYPYPVIEAAEFHLWPKERECEPTHPYWWYYPWHRYPYGPAPWWAW
jgi:outer membrane lipoprotein